MKIIQFLKELTEEVKINARVKVIKASLDKAIAETEEEVANATYKLDTFSMIDDPVNALNDYLKLKSELEDAKTDLEFKKEAFNELFSEK